MVPHPIGPDHGDRPGGTDLQAIGLGPLHPAPRHQPEFLEPAFEKFPRFLASVARAAFLLFGNGAKEDVSRDGIAADLAQRP